MDCHKYVLEGHLKNSVFRPICQIMEVKQRGDVTTMIWIRVYIFICHNQELYVLKYDNSKTDLIIYLELGFFFVETIRIQVNCTWNVNIIKLCIIEKRHDDLWLVTTEIWSNSITCAVHQIYSGIHCYQKSDHVQIQSSTSHVTTDSLKQNMKNSKWQIRKIYTLREKLVAFFLWVSEFYYYSTRLRDGCIRL